MKIENKRHCKRLYAKGDIFMGEAVEYLMFKCDMYSGDAISYLNS